MVHKACCCAGCCCYKVVGDDYTVHQIEGLSKLECLCPDDPECPDPDLCKCGNVPEITQQVQWSMWSPKPCSDETCEVGCCCYKDKETGCWKHRDTDSGLVGYYYPDERKIGGCYNHPSGVPPYWHLPGRTCEGLDREAIEEYGEDVCLENCGEWDVLEGPYGESLGEPRYSCGPACGNSMDVEWWKQDETIKDLYKLPPNPWDSTTTEGPCCQLDGDNCEITDSKWHCEDPECGTSWEGGGYFGVEGEDCSAGCKKGFAIAFINCNATVGGNYRIQLVTDSGVVELGTNANSANQRDAELSLPAHVLDDYIYDESIIRESLGQLCGPIADLSVIFIEELNYVRPNQTLHIRGLDIGDDGGTYSPFFFWWPFGEHLAQGDVLTLDTNNYVAQQCCPSSSPWDYLFEVTVTHLENECGYDDGIESLGACCDSSAEEDEYGCMSCEDELTEEECGAERTWIQGKYCSDDPRPCPCRYMPCCIVGTPLCPLDSCDGGGVTDGSPGNPPYAYTGPCEYITEEGATGQAPNGCAMLQYHQCVDNNGGEPFPDILSCDGGDPNVPVCPERTVSGKCCLKEHVHCDCGGSHIKQCHGIEDMVYGDAVDECARLLQEANDGVGDGEIWYTSYFTVCADCATAFAGGSNLADRCVADDDDVWEVNTYSRIWYTSFGVGGLEGCSNCNYEDTRPECVELLPPDGCADWIVGEGQDDSGHSPGEIVPASCCTGPTTSECCPEGHCCCINTHPDPNIAACAPHDNYMFCSYVPCGQLFGTGPGQINPLCQCSAGTPINTTSPCEGEYLCPPCCEENPDCSRCDGPMCNPECNESNSNYVVFPADGGDSYPRPCCIPDEVGRGCVDMLPSQCRDVGGEVDYNSNTCRDFSACSYYQESFS